MKYEERKELERDALRGWVTSPMLKRAADRAGNGDPTAMRDFYHTHLDVRENPYKGKYALDPEGMQKFRKKIQEGTIDIGPFPDHSGPVADRRPKP